ncbi:MAG: transposase [Rhodocyclaceae bacterium]|nr:transposase [Rhodocyclaceae bacterium]
MQGTHRPHRGAEGGGRRRPAAQREEDEPALRQPLLAGYFQERAEFYAYYDHYWYLPLHVFAGRAMLACVLRRGRIDGAKHAAGVIKLLVTRLRQAWPTVRLIVRGDSGFCRQRMIRWCERHGVGYVIGVVRNARLHRIVARWEPRLEARYTTAGK